MTDIAASVLAGTATVGFIGLGHMGGPMARCLIRAGLPVIVQDISPAVARTIAGDEARIVATPAALAAEADVILMSLPTPDIVSAVCEGPDGIMAGGATRIVIDLSTTGPRATERLAARFAEKGVAFIDAPVSGGVSAAEQGTLTIMAAGDKAAYDAIEPLLKIVGGKLFYMGGQAGMGQSMKLVNNMLAAVNAMGAFEVLVLGAKLGLDAQQMLDVLNVSSGQNFMTSVKIPQCVMPRTFPPRFATTLMHKDVRLCLEEADAAGAQMWVGQVVRQMLAFAIAQGGGDKDFAATIQHYEQWAGATVGSAPLPAQQAAE
ncbi:NAD(P)-dependent oxidoreductase [Sphingobium amiense]|uniref:NAD(P)-dependent oxidoreductase n=1 Tax=Sphingobium amiense TaxID=135719 RepID=A0A494WDE8_9SPHN|nr:NAD(P)-dependent oxidoreductase [Sphingobium amiense]BBD98409.1 NAD(P)-dependent oxidoreductase [Sphingobium amiense]